MSTPANPPPSAPATSPAAGLNFKTIAIVAVVAAAAWYFLRDKAPQPPAAPAP